MILSNSYINLRIRISPDSLAQLGERHLDRVEVAGSSPVGIIGAKPNVKTVGTTVFTKKTP